MRVKLFDKYRKWKKRRFRKNNRRIFCQWPYSGIFITLDGMVRPCCFGPACGDLNKDDIETIWNGNEMVRRREGLLEGDLEAAGCGECGWINRRNIETYDRCEDLGQSLAIRKNIKLQRKEYKAGLLSLESFPSNFTIQLTEACNFRCIMCFQQHQHKHLSEDILTKIMNNSDKIDEFKFTGGEPLVSKWIPEFIEAFNPENGQKIGFTTNGSLIGKFKHKLEEMPRLFLAISVHAAKKETFESIKVGGNWQSIYDNVVWYASERRRRRPFWDDGRLTFVVMSKNYEEIPDFLKWLRELEMPALFQPVWGERAQEYNIFEYPELRSRLTHPKKIYSIAKEIVKDMPDQERNEILMSLRYTLDKLDDWPDVS